MAPPRIQKQSQVQSQFRETLRNLIMLDLPKEEFKLVGMWMWHIWYNRNLMINEERFLDPKCLAAKAKNHPAEFQQVQETTVDRTERGSHDAARADYWLPPPPGIYKINLHISFSSPTSCVRRGFIIRDGKGLVTAAEIGLVEVVLEVPSKALAKALLEHVEDDSSVGHIFDEARHELFYFNFWNVSYSSPASNKAARCLAQEAKIPISFDIWLEDYPVFLRDFV
ncbi:hypothetical protein FCV25MIE_16326 [Fagus crenata]